MAKRLIITQVSIPATSTAPATPPPATPPAAPASAALAPGGSSSAAPSASAAPAASPASTPAAAPAPVRKRITAAARAPKATQTTGYETKNANDFVNRLNLGTAIDEPQLLSLAFQSIFEAENAFAELDIILPDHKINFVSGTISNGDDLVRELDLINQTCTTALVHNHSLTPPLDQELSRNIRLTLTYVRNIATLTKLNYNTSLNRILASRTPSPVIAGGGAPTPGAAAGAGGASGAAAGAGPAAAVGAPTYTSVSPESQMQNEWRTVEAVLKLEDKDYEHKRGVLEAYRDQLMGGAYGDVSAAPIVREVGKVKELLEKTSKILNEMNFGTDITNSRILKESVDGLIKKAKEAETVTDLEEVSAAVKDLKKDFRSNIAQARKIKIPREETKSGTDKSKVVYREINLGDNPLVFYMLFADMSSMIKDELGDKFFEEQKERVKKLEKAKESIDTAINVALTAIKGADASILESSSVNKTKKGWDDFLVIYRDKIKELQSIIDAQIIAIKGIVGDDTDKIKKHANKKRDELVTAVSVLTKLYNLTKLPSGAPKGASANKIWSNIHQTIDGAASFIGAMNLTIPSLDAAPAAGTNAVTSGPTARRGVAGQVAFTLAAAAATLAFLGLLDNNAQDKGNAKLKKPAAEAPAAETPTLPTPPAAQPRVKTADEILEHLASKDKTSVDGHATIISIDAASIFDRNIKSHSQLDPNRFTAPQLKAFHTLRDNIVSGNSSYAFGRISVLEADYNIDRTSISNISIVYTVDSILKWYLSDAGKREKFVIYVGGSGGADIFHSQDIDAAKKVIKEYADKNVNMDDLTVLEMLKGSHYKHMDVCEKAGSSGRFDGACKALVAKYLDKAKGRIQIN